MSGAFRFELEAADGAARAGRFHTPHGSFATPVFMPVGTRAAMKGITFEQLESMHCEILLANAYHLMQRPGEEVVRDLGGVHRFMGWDGPMLTDSGGFQVWSLAELRRMDADGVTFKSERDGKMLRLTPESSVANEFGRLWDNDQLRIILADEISPDSCRLWDIETDNKLDKDRFRRDLGNVLEAYQEVARRLGVLNESRPPQGMVPVLVASNPSGANS